MFTKPLAPGSFAAWGRIVGRNLTFLEEATCPGQLRCLGQNLFGWDAPPWGPRFEPKSSQIHPRALLWTALAPSCSSRPGEKTHFATCRFPMCLLIFSRLRRSFLRVFSISMFRFSPIIYRGLGHHFCNCGASLVPLWVPLPLFSSPPGLFYTLLAVARGSPKAVFFD